MNVVFKLDLSLMEYYLAQEGIVMDSKHTYSLLHVDIKFPSAPKISNHIKNIFSKLRLLECFFDSLNETLIINIYYEMANAYVK